MAARRSMRKVQVRAPGGRYPIIIGRGAIAELSGVLGASGKSAGKKAASRKSVPSSVVWVSDSKVSKHHGATLERNLRSTKLPTTRIVLPAGEKTKSIAQLDRIWRHALKSEMDRSGMFVAFGGGVIGDLTGFAAATTLRGVSFVQVPTTLLAMVDASVGGKTGINLPEGKNLVGSFHQPRAVIMDLDFLKTLPAREVRAGWAEIIKTAAIRDPALFRKIVRHREALLGGDERLLGEVIASCVKIKAAVVEEDEKESGLRMILNFGHTMAHGIEAAQSYGKLLHGEAVAIGMVFALRLGERLGLSEPGLAEKVEETIRSFGLPVRLQGARPEPIFKAMKKDKKRGPRGLRWVFVESLGKTSIRDDVPESLVRAELKAFLGDKK